MEKRWIYPQQPDQETVARLAACLHINASLASLLAQRQINTFEEAKTFFRPQLQHLHDPFLMKDMHHAVNRLVMAIENQEKVLVYGDYDVDGTTSVALVYGFLRDLCPEIDFYIPDRYTEGYGISEQGIAWAADNGFSLIISLDCGIRAVKLIGEARKKCIDFIVCDHHRPGDDLPPAHAILDTKQPGCSYPYKELSGCGVGFKLLQGLCTKLKLDPRPLYDYLDLVAVSISADIVPITGENRVLTYFGLQKINSNPRPGLEMLMEVACLKKPIDVTKLVFGVAPRINAAGRMEHAKAAVHLLLAENQEKAASFADNLHHKNSQRKDFDKSITQEAIEMIESSEWCKDAKSTVLFKNDWHKGVIGIVASRCIEKYYRPTIILTESNNKATGSARSVHGFDIYNAIAECEELLERFGGHTYAAGLTLALDKVPEFQKKFEEVVAQRILPEQLIPRIDIDRKICLSEIDRKFYNIISQMAPFGPQNMCPVYCCDNLLVYGEVQVLKDAHLKFRVRQLDDESGTCLPAIAFGMKEKLDIIEQGQPFAMVFTVDNNEFNGSSSLQLMVKDLQSI